jgi:putative transposase
MTAYVFDKNNHSVYSLNYHFIQCIKYRRKVLDFPEIIDDLKQRTLRIAASYGVEIISIETDLDHVHILFKSMPQTELLKFLNNWKSATSKALKNKYYDRIKDKLWINTFWSASYCLITTGQTTLDQIKKYVENQGRNNATNSKNSD